MLKVGLTGNIGSGKSVVAQIFATLGIPVFHADQESKQMLELPEVKSRVSQLFGESVLTASGTVDRGKLASIVFSDTVKLNLLNELMHPLVMKAFIEWCDKQKTPPYIIHEAAIIFESGIRGAFDKIIHVACPPEIAIERIMLRDKTGRESILKRMQHQMEETKKAAMSDFIIRNDGAELIIPQVVSIHQQLLEIGA